MFLQLAFLVSASTVAPVEFATSWPELETARSYRECLAAVGSETARTSVLHSAAARGDIGALTVPRDVFDDLGFERVWGSSRSVRFQTNTRELFQLVKLSLNENSDTEAEPGLAAEFCSRFSRPSATELAQADILAIRNGADFCALVTPKSFRGRSSGARRQLARLWCRYRNLGLSAMIPPTAVYDVVQRLDSLVLDARPEVDGQWGDILLLGEVEPEPEIPIEPGGAWAHVCKAYAAHNLAERERFGHIAGLACGEVFESSASAIEMELSLVERPEKLTLQDRAGQRDVSLAGLREAADGSWSIRMTVQLRPGENDLVFRAWRRDFRRRRGWSDANYLLALVYRLEEQ